MCWDLQVWSVSLAAFGGCCELCIRMLVFDLSDMICSVSIAVLQRSVDRIYLITCCKTGA